MHVFEAWLVYLIVVAVVWIVLVGVDAFKGMTAQAKFFLALLAGAIVVFFMTAGIEIHCPDDRFWLCLLLLLAYLAPLLIGLWLLWRGGWDNMRNFAMGENGQTKIDKVFVCENQDCYPIMTEIKTKAGSTKIFHQ